jgi:hypothetical protein
MSKMKDRFGRVGVAALLATMVVGGLVPTPHADAAPVTRSPSKLTRINPTYATTADVGRRSSPTTAPDGGYGIPVNTPFVVQCQVLGQPFPNGNALYFLTNYNGNTYVPDYYTNSPHRSTEPPIAGIPMCNAPSGTYVSRAAPMYLCTNTGNVGCRPSGMPSVSANQQVSMVCWKDGSNYTGDYTTNRWFWVVGPAGEGYASASVVRNQTSVPACDSKPAFVAADVALARYGQVWASTGDKALFANSEWLPGDVGEWSGDCVKLPYVAWKAVGITIPKQDAITNYYNLRSRLQGGAPPRGAVAFYNVTSWGHEVIGVGNGFVATTQGLDGSYTPITVKPWNSWSNFLGWYLPG